MSLSFTIYQFHRSRQDTKALRQTDILAARRLQLIEALLWFEAPKPQRSAALAVIEGHWDEYPDLHTSWVAVLVASSTDIITKPDISLSGQDERDLWQMLAVLERTLDETNPKSSVYQRLVSPIATAVSELGSRVVRSESGDPVPPNRRKGFISAVQHVVSQFPRILASTNSKGIDLVHSLAS